MRCSVEVEVFETSPTVSYEVLSRGRVATAVSGTVIDADAAVEINSLNGFCVTRRKEIQVTESAVATLAEVVALQRETVLHDGRRQVWIRSTWPEESEVLGQVVDRIVAIDPPGLTRRSSHCRCGSGPRRNATGV